MIRRRWISIAFVLAAVTFGGSRSRREVIPGTATMPAQAGQGMVSSAHPLATQAGLDILKAGGNAFDAAVAVAAVLNVVEPMMSGMGGYGTILIYDASGRRVRFLNSSGQIPVAVDSDVFRAPTPGYEGNRSGPKADLAADKAEWWEPIHINYRGYEVYTASPPATSFCSLIRLGMMSRFDPRTLGHNSAAYLHRFAEVSKHAFWCRLAYAGDPETNPPPLAKLLSEAYWKEETAKIDPKKARPFVPPGAAPQGSAHTTHFVVADRWGNLVSATQTLGNLFGSRIMPEGTGIWLNNSLAYCTFEPKGNPMDAHAGHHKLSGDCPTIIFKDGKPWAAIGTPGGHTIGQTVPQMVMNLIDFGMNIQEAIAAPFISFYEPDFLLVEKRIPQPVQDELIKMGHQVRAVDGLTNAHGIIVKYDAKGRPVRFSGGSDPRGEGEAAGY